MSARQAAVATEPLPSTTARPGATPGAPPSSLPRPGPGRFSSWAPISAAMRPATWLMGVRRGREPSGFCTFSKAIAVTPEVRTASVKSGRAGRWRKLKRMSSGRRRPNSGGSSSFTLTSRSHRPATSWGLSTNVAPARRYSSSLKPLPSPAPRSTIAVWPACARAPAPAGVRPTRSSPSFASLMVPTFIWPLPRT